MGNIKSSLVKLCKPEMQPRCSTESAAAANLQEDLANLLKDEEGADVTFSVGDRLFRAHRRVLAARSPVFKAELLGEMEESSSSSAQHVIQIDDMEPSVFAALLHFIYTDSLPDDLGDVDGNAPLQQHLLVAADRYGLHRLAAMCEWKLCRSIDVQTVATTLALAEQHHRVRLKNACIRFVSSKGVFGAIKETDGFSHLMESCRLVMVDMLEQKLPSRVQATWKAVWSRQKQAAWEAVWSRQTQAAWEAVWSRQKQAVRRLTCWLVRRVGFRSVCVLVVVSYGVSFVVVSYDGDYFTKGGNEWSSWSWLPRAVSLERLQEWQESTWVNSDI